MFPPGVLIGYLFNLLQAIVYSTAAPAITVAPQRAELDATDNPVAATLDVPGTDVPIGAPIHIRVTNADNAVTLAFTGPAGAVTLTLALDDVLVLYAASATAWGVLAAPASAVQLGTSTGKMGFFGAAPAAQPAAFTQTYATAARSHPAATTNTIADNSGGTASTSALEDVTEANNAGSADRVPTENNLATLAAEQALLKADLLALKKLVNAIIDDHQSLGLAAA
jgi:hypothetical protein